MAPVVLDTADLLDYRSAHPLSQVFPLLYDVLGRAAVDCDCVLAVGDAEGRMLWVCGPPGVLRQAEAINFVEGSAWAVDDRRRIEGFRTALNLVALGAMTLILRLDIVEKP